MKSILSFFVFLLPLVFVFSQVSKKVDLQNKNNKLLREIASLEEQLRINSKESTTSLLYLKTLEEKIEKQKKLVANVSKEKRIINDEIYLQQLKINKLSRELNLLRKNFSKFLVHFYKRKSLQNKFLFVFSAKSLTEVYRRIYYLKIIAKYQNRQAKEILKKKSNIEEIKKTRQAALIEKKELLVKEKLFIDKLQQESAETENVVFKYRNNKEEITMKINKNQKERRDLEGRIQIIIKEEIRIAKEKVEAERKAREAEIARIKAEEAERRRKELVLAKEREEVERKKKEAELLALKKTEAQRLEKETLLAKIKAEEIERREVAKKSLVEEKKRRDQKEAERLLKKTEEKRVKQEKELAGLKLLEENKIKEIEARKENERIASLTRAKEEKEKRELYENKTSASITKDATNFSNAKGSLSSPLRGGVIVGFYGKGFHPVLKNIEVDNRGIDLAGSRGSKAKAVFPGKVTAVYVVPGGNKAVLLQHGIYFTLYHNLSSVFVKKGDNIQLGQILGRVYTDSDGNTILNFQVWKGTSTENPQLWLAGY